MNGDNGDGDMNGDPIKSAQTNQLISWTDMALSDITS